MNNKITIPIIIVLLLIITSLTIYIFNNNKAPVEKECLQKDKDNDISLTDRYISFVSVSSGLANYQIFIVDDGKLYYNVGETNTYYYDDIDNFDLPKLTEYKDLKNIKRIKETGLGFNILAITDDGKVYSIYYNYETKSLYQTIENEFEDYQVDDIIYYVPPSGCVDYMDCTIKIKTIDSEIIEK